MCFALLALSQHPAYPFILAANRDEFTARPAQVLHDWEDIPGVLAGRDLTSMGSWLALNRIDRRLALVTNVRDGSRQTAERSRGLLIRDLADARQDFNTSLQTVVAEQTRYAGFNVLAGMIDRELYYFSNRTQQSPLLLQPGCYGLSNAALDTPWPKVEKGKQRLGILLKAPLKTPLKTPSSQQASAAGLATDLFTILADDEQADDALLPSTGISPDWERRLSAVFIRGEDYRTRCATVVLMDNNKSVYCWERSFDSAGEFSEQHFIF